MRVGDIEIQPILDGSHWEVADKVMRRPGVEDCWACHHGAVDEHNHMHFALGGFLVRTGERVVLVDTGVGAFSNGQYTGGGFLDSLAALGVKREQVTDVLFTHLHFDHVGWATRKGEVMFPNATYRAHALDWAHFMEGPNAVEGALRKLGPIAPQLKLFDQDCTLAPGLDARHAPGHTPGSTVFIVSSGSARALMLGDVVHSVVQLAERDWEALSDIDPVAASRVRNAIADEIADTQDLVVAGHFPGLQFGRVVTTGGRRHFTSP